MKKMTLVFTSFILFFLSCPTFSQSNTFSVEAYKQFVETHQNMDGGELMQMHDAGTFLNQIPAQTQTALYLDTIESKYGLTDYEKSLIEKNGFMVSERLKSVSLGTALTEIFYKDLPLFISTDALLHALHISYDRVLKDIELGYIIPKLITILDELQKKIPTLKTEYAAKPEMIKSMEDVDLYIGLANRLLTNQSTFTFSTNLGKADSLITQIAALKMEPVTMFSENCRLYDFSQFKVRGHYTDYMYPVLAKYFQAMMWLGRTEIYLTPPKSAGSCSYQSKNDIQRQIIDAMLISKLMDISGMQSSFDEIDGIIEFFVGKSDNVTLNNLTFLKDKIQITDPGELLDTNKVNVFQTELSKNEFAYQRILSQVLINNGTDSIVPASAFLLLGQRFIIDSYVFSQVVYDRIKSRRMLPQSLDVLFALGNDASAQLLQSELEKYHYSTNLASLRYLIDAYSDEFWNSSMYNSWLNAIRTINPPKDRGQLPPFMQTAAYWQSKMNTQLASWAQLRHDNLLYAKQSYSGIPTCSYPFVYVEPIPDFYKNLKSYATIALQKFQSVSFDEPHFKNVVLNYFNNLYSISDTLGSIAKKELAKELLSDNEKHFLQTTLVLEPDDPYAHKQFDGWFSKLFYENGLNQFDINEINHFVVADVHTSPANESGKIVGWVKHVGTGPFNLGVWIANNDENKPVAFIGPALSYHEYTSTNFLRLTDEEWAAQYLSASPRPSFVNSYLADSAGNTKGNGAMLFTSIERKDNPTSSMNYLVAQNYPNPFNPSTIISFTIPEAMARQNVSLKIYNINGELIKTFFEKDLPAGNYVTRWDGTNESGSAVPSGVYLYKVTAGNNFVTGKMSLVK